MTWRGPRNRVPRSASNKHERLGQHIPSRSRCWLGVQSRQDEVLSDDSFTGTANSWPLIRAPKTSAGQNTLDRTARKPHAIAGAKTALDQRDKARYLAEATPKLAAFG